MNYGSRWTATIQSSRPHSTAPARSCKSTSSARVVKSLNQLGYHQLENRRPKRAPDRIAIGAAGDHRFALKKVMRLLDRLGFDPVDAGPLKNGPALEPDGSPIAAT